MRFDDILSTNHKLNSFKIERKPKVNHLVYNFTKANWSGLRHVLSRMIWNSCFVPGNIDETLSDWCDMFLKVVDQYIPKHYIKNAYDHLWMDKELLQLIRRKNRQRKKLKKFPNPVNIEKYKILRHLTKRLIKKKKKNYGEKLAKSPCMKTLVKHSTMIRKNVTFLKKTVNPIRLTSARRRIS